MTQPLHIPVLLCVQVIDNSGFNVGHVAGDDFEHGRLARRAAHLVLFLIEERFQDLHHFGQIEAVQIQNVRFVAVRELGRQTIRSHASNFITLTDRVD